MIIHTMPQRSPEWYAVRFGKITGSTFYQFMGTGKTVEDRIFEKAAEHLTHQAAVDSFESIDTERGKTLEDEAAFLYSVMTGRDVKQVGFIEYNAYAGCSPDGLVADDGMIETKCPRQAGHLKTVINGFIKPEYRWQMQYNLFIADREWCDFVSYCKPFGKPHIIRVDRDPECSARIAEKLEELSGRIQEIINMYNERITHERIHNCL